MPRIERRYHVYVIRLYNRVMRESARFRSENPCYEEGRPVVYVGSTAHSPEKRFEQHVAGGRVANSYVRDFGKRLFEWAYEDLPTFETREEAEMEEERHAQRLRARGWGVWQA